VIVVATSVCYFEVLFASEGQLNRMFIGFTAAEVAGAKGHPGGQKSRRPRRAKTPRKIFLEFQPWGQLL
jgi:hypothetical protein